MPLALPDHLDYKPTEDDRRVAQAVLDAGEQLANEDLAARAALPTDRLNRAVLRLKDKRAIEILTVLNSAPYAFYSAMPTGETIRYLEKLK